MSLDEAKAILKNQLDQFNIILIREKGKTLFLESEYTIEIENPRLFKLLHAQQVVAPFDDIQELCEFIQMDKSFNT